MQLRGAQLLVWETDAQLTLSLLPLDHWAQAKPTGRRGDERRGSTTMRRAAERTSVRVATERKLSGDLWISGKEPIGGRAGRRRG